MIQIQTNVILVIYLFHFRHFLYFSSALLSHLMSSATCLYLYSGYFLQPALMSGFSMFGIQVSHRACSVHLINILKRFLIVNTYCLLTWAGVDGGRIATSTIIAHLVIRANPELNFCLP